MRARVGPGFTPQPLASSGACRLQFNISYLGLVEDQKTESRSLRDCPNFREWLTWGQD